MLVEVTLVIFLQVVFDLFEWDDNRTYPKTWIAMTHKKRKYWNKLDRTQNMQHDKIHNMMIEITPAMTKCNCFKFLFFNQKTTLQQV